MKDQISIEKQFVKWIFLASSLGLASQVACSRPPSSFDLASEELNFAQSASFASNKVDILWVIDNSNSMQTSQNRVAEGLISFILQLTQAGIDYQIAVITTDSYLSQTPGFKKSGLLGGTPHPTGIITPQDIANNGIEEFVKLVIQGNTGDGDERPLQSISQTLGEPSNRALFLRDGAYLSVIVLTDEDDFSHDTMDIIVDPTDPRLWSKDDFLSQLSSIIGLDKLSFSTISIGDPTCLASLQNEFQERRTANRLQEIVLHTSGSQISLCDISTQSTAEQALSQIAGQIAELNRIFKLERLPRVETLRVWINSVEIQQDATSGFTYDADLNAVVFSGDLVPQNGDRVQIYFDPVGIKN